MRINRHRLHEMKSLALPLLAFALVGCAASGPAAVTGMLAAYDEHPVQVAALVVDLDTGEALLSRDARRLFRPASTMKLLPTSAICRRHQGGAVLTRVVADKVPAGNVTLIGGGDPLLSTDDLRALAL